MFEKVELLESLRPARFWIFVGLVLFASQFLALWYLLLRLERSESDVWIESGKPNIWTVHGFSTIRRFKRAMKESMPEVDDYSRIAFLAWRYLGLAFAVIAFWLVAYELLEFFWR